MKKNNLKKNLLNGISVITLGIILGLGIQFVSAWTNAPTTPPNGNVAGPLTTGNGTQTKSGGDLQLGGGGSLYAGGLVAAPTLCIGADCKTTWPSGSGTGDNLGNHIATQNLDMNNKSIKNVPTTPLAGTDAVNKDYVDAAVSGASGKRAFTYTSKAGVHACPSGWTKILGGTYWLHTLGNGDVQDVVCIEN